MSLETCEGESSSINGKSTTDLPSIIYCDRLVWFETYQDIHKAIAREKQVKRWRRVKKTGLIEKANPAWVDLSKDWYDLEPADLKRATDRMN